MHNVVAAWLLLLTVLYVFAAVTLKLLTLTCVL